MACEISDVMDGQLIKMFMVEPSTYAFDILCWMCGGVSLPPSRGYVARCCKDRIQDALFSVIRYVSYLLFLYFLERLHYDAIPRSAMLVSSDRIF